MFFPVFFLLCLCYFRAVANVCVSESTLNVWCVVKLICISVDNFVWSDLTHRRLFSRLLSPLRCLSQQGVFEKKKQCYLCAGVFRKWLWRWNRLTEDIYLSGFWLWKAGKCQLTWISKNRLEDITQQMFPTTGSCRWISFCHKFQSYGCQVWFWRLSPNNADGNSCQTV